MRRARVRADRSQGASYQHLMAKTAGGDRIWDVRNPACPNARRFRDLLARQEAFSGLRILTWCLMSNHVHLLVEEPAMSKEPIAEEEVLRRVGVLNGPGAQRELAFWLHHFRQEVKNPLAAEELLDRYRARMGDVSRFMQDLKSRFAQWYNRQNNRFGALWGERFRNVLVEDGEALAVMAAYIDLNPVRAGMVHDPKDYRWSGYGEAVAAGAKAAAHAREGLRQILDLWAKRRGDNRWETASWRTIHAAYRSQMYIAGEAVPADPRTGESGRPGFRREEVEKVLKAGGRLSPPQALGCRLRYLTDGVALGSREFVERVFEEHRNSFGPKRREGARPMKGLPWQSIFTLRALRKDPVS